MAPLGAVVVGGGIAGLAAAHRLRVCAPELALTLVERAPRLGGKLLTEHHQGFVVEGAPDSFLSNKPAGIALSEELGLAGQLQGYNLERRKTYVLREGRLYPLPDGLTGLIPTNLDALAASELLSEQGRARVAQEPSIPAAPEHGDETVASFIIRRFGQEAYDRLIEPLMGGIYAGNAAQLSLASTFPQLRRLELSHGSLLKGLLASSGSAPAPRYAPFVSFRQGMGALVERLVERLGPAARCGSGVQRIARVGRGYRLELEDGALLDAGALVLATPAYVSAALLSPLDEELASLHAALPYASAITVSLAYRQDELPGPLDGFGYLIPGAEGGDILACTWSSSKWQGRAPAGYALLRVYLGRYGRDAILAEPDLRLEALARQELRQTLGIEAEPCFTRIYRWPRSMPQYLLGHPQRLAAIERGLERHPGLFLAGAAYRGVGIPDCIASGERAAAAVVRYLKG